MAAPPPLELSIEGTLHAVTVIPFDEVSQVVEIQLQLKVRIPALCLFLERLLLLLLLLLLFVLICIRSFTTAPRAKAAPFISITSRRAI